MINKKHALTILMTCVATSTLWSMASPRNTSPERFLASNVLVYYIDGSGNLANRSLPENEAIQLGAQTSILHGQRYYFYGATDGGQAARGRVLDLPENRTTLISNASSNHSSISQCISNSNIQEGTAQRAKFNFLQVCGGGNARPNTGGTSDYVVAKRNGQIEVDLKVMLTYRGRPENRERTLVRVREMHRCVKDLYARSGIQLNLALYLDRGARDGYISVNLWDYYSEREDARNWAAFGNDSTGTGVHEMNLQEACTSTAHEVGHLLGLPDRYTDQQFCPARRSTGSSDDIMASIGYDSRTQHINEQDLRAIISPLCEGRRVLAEDQSIATDYATASSIDIGSFFHSIFGTSNNP